MGEKAAEGLVQQAVWRNWGESDNPNFGALFNRQ